MAHLATTEDRSKSAAAPSQPLISAFDVHLHTWSWSRRNEDRTGLLRGTCYSATQVPTYRTIYITLILVHGMEMHMRCSLTKWTSFETYHAALDSMIKATRLNHILIPFFLQFVCGYLKIVLPYFVLRNTDLSFSDVSEPMHNHAFDHHNQNLTSLRWDNNALSSQQHGIVRTSNMPPLEYGCSEWRMSSQVAFNLFNNGSKLWTKADLRDIEQQLAQSETCEVFTVRSIQRNLVTIKNPMFGERTPLWYALTSNLDTSLTMSIL